MLLEGFDVVALCLAGFFMSFFVRFNKPDYLYGTISQHFLHLIHIFFLKLVKNITVVFFFANKLKAGAEFSIFLYIEQELKFF